MQEYKAPIRDFQFVMQEMLDCSTHYESLGYSDATPDMVDAILTEAGKFSEKVLAPINQSGDAEGCSWENGVVTTPKGFKEAYQQYVDGGWQTLAQSPTYGGQGLPHSLATTISEMLSSANHSFAMYPGLSHGCMATLEKYGTEQQKSIFLSKLIEGTWTGTMCLTEAHCGTDLGMLQTKAELNDDGSYRLNGSKIFISAGEHDLSDNIVHLVIARVAGAPAGTKGISLFVVPKFNVTDSGDIADRNGVNCGSIEHKMGINANATCVINFDDAKGYLVGTENRGLHCMFTFMNSARVGVANEGVSASEAAFQGSLRYAKERLQSRSLSGVKNPTGPADPIIVHPDVRKMLLTQKCFAEGGRAMVCDLAQSVDIVHASQDPELTQIADAKLALLTPIAKAFLTETAVEATNYGIQVLGGHGYVKEWGMEQLLRDTRICCIYEGTTGIQALDLLGRKVLGSNSAMLDVYISEINTFIDTKAQAPELANVVSALREYLTQWSELTASIAARVAHNKDEIGAASVDYLMFAGYVSLGFYWLKSMTAALAGIEFNPTERSFYESKIKTGQFYFDRILPRATGHSLCIHAGAESMMALSADEFVF